ncbi:hypothetical protein ANN_28069 [Periplaneta americana]|uniref:Uncharacterized protein n=1 Tax=Periplaneta americana TaxID=6978 RepID=A0ABQ8RUU2_PERAM|nr:hypothetical protein ANN_28069 [Periplaneta americana]
MSPGSSTESYPAFARIGLRENPGKNLNQLTCPDQYSNPGHLVSQPDALTVTPQLHFSPYHVVPDFYLLEILADRRQTSISVECNVGIVYKYWRHRSVLLVIFTQQLSFQSQVQQKRRRKIVNCIQPTSSRRQRTRAEFSVIPSVSKPEQASQSSTRVCVRICVSIRRPEFECSGPQLEGPEFECSGPQLEGPEFEYSELSLKDLSQSDYQILIMFCELKPWYAEHHKSTD